MNGINNFPFSSPNKRIIFFRFLFPLFSFFLSLFFLTIFFIFLRSSFALRLSRNTALTEHRHFIPAYYPSVLLFRQPRFYFFILTHKLYIFSFQNCNGLRRLFFLHKKDGGGGRLRLGIFYLKSLFVFIML